MAYLQGTVGEYKDGSQILGEGRLRVSFDGEIYKLNLDKALLLMLTSKLGAESVGRMKHQWQTKERKSDFVATTAFGGNWKSGADDDGTITVSTANAKLFAAGDLILIPAESDAKVIYVNSVVLSTGVLTCELVDQSQTIDLSTSTEDILRLSNSFEVGSGKGTIISQQPTTVDNMVQIIQTPIGITTTARNLEYRGVDEYNELKFEAGVDHAFKLEKALWFGQKQENNTGLTGMPGVYEQHMMGGVRGFLSTNVTSLSAGALTRNAFGDWVNDFTQYAKNPIIFCGERIYEALTLWSESKLEITRNEKTLGMAVTQYLTPYGTQVKVVPHRELFTGDLTGIAFGIDMADIKRLYLKGLDTHLEVDIQQPDLKQKIDEYRTWMSLKLINEKRHGYLWDVGSITV